MCLTQTFLSLNQKDILETVNDETITSKVTGNPVDVRSLLGEITEDSTGKIVKAEVGFVCSGLYGVLFPHLVRIPSPCIEIHPLPLFLLDGSVRLLDFRLAGALGNLTTLII